MAKYILERNDGTAYELEGPEGASKEDLVRVLEQKLRPQRPSGGSTADRLRALRASRPAYEAPPRESTMGEEFMRTLRGTLSSGRTGIASLIGDENEQARAGLERAEAISEDYGVGPSFEKVKETYDEEGLLAAIAEGAGQIPRYVAQQLPTLAQAVAGAKAGAMLTPGPLQAKAVGAIAGGVGAFLPTFAGSNIERRAQEQQEAGQEIDVDVAGAYGTAIGQSALQGVGSAAILGKNAVRKILGADVVEEVAERELRTLAERGVLQNIARRGATGAAGEVPTEVAQQMLERYYAGLPLADEEAKKEYGEAAYASALGGGVLGGVTGVSDSAINRRNLEAFEAEQRTATIPVVGADNKNLGSVRVVRISDNEVVREDFDANGKLKGNKKRYMGEEGTKALRDFKKIQREGGAINENVLNTEYAATEVTPTTPPVAKDQEIKGKVEVPAGMEEAMARFEGAPPVDTAVETVPTWESLTPGQMVTLYRGESSANIKNGEWWTTDPEKAKKYGVVTEVTLPSEVVAAHSARGNGADEFVFPNRKPAELAVEPTATETVAPEAAAPVEPEVQPAPEAAALTAPEVQPAPAPVEPEVQPAAPEATAPVESEVQPASKTTTAPKTTTSPAATAEPIVVPVEDRATSGLTPKLVQGVRREAIPVMAEDTETVQRNLKLSRPTGGFGAFGQYVSDMGGDVPAAVRAVAGDLVLLDPAVRSSATAEERAQDKVEYNAAKKAETWIRKTLSKPAKAALDAQIKEFKDLQKRGQAKAAKEDAAIKRRRAARETDRRQKKQAIAAFNEWLRDNKLQQQKGNPVDFADSLVADESATAAERADDVNQILDDLGVNYRYDDGFYLQEDATAASSVPMTEAQIALANSGDLSGVLQNIEDTSANNDVKRMAKALKANIGGTTLEVVDGLTGANGKQVAGLFDPATNTIRLNSRVMLRPHTIMHEMAHAATSHTLNNKSHLVTTALTKLFNDVKSQLDTEYGTKSLDEFVAEAFSNIQFRQKLAAIMVPAGDGKKITAFQRLKNVVGNLLRTLMGRPTVSIDRKEDALTQVDALIRNILSPAPNVRNSPELYAMLAEGGKGAETVMATVLAPFRGASTTIDPQALARARAVLAPMSRARVEMMTYLLPLNAQIELAADIIPSAKGLFPLLQRKKATRDNEMQKMTDLKKILEQAFKGQAKQREIFNDLVPYSTIFKADPSLPEAEAKKKYGKDPERMAAYEDMTENYWKKLSPAQQAAYKELRDYYAEGYQKIRTLIDARIEEMVTDNDQKGKLKTLLLKDVLSKESIEPYFPLSRSGKFWLQYEAISPYTGEVELFKRSFDSLAERDLKMNEVRNDATRTAQLRARGVDGARLEVIGYERAQNESSLEKVPTGFAYRIMNELKATNAPVEIQNLITEMLLNAMPENSLARMFKPRAGTLGFKTDALTVLQDRAPSIITQVTNLEYDGPLSKQLAKMQEDVKVSDDPHKQVWLESFTKYIDYSRAPFISPWSRRFKSLGFLYTLGFNVSSVLVNMTNPAVVTYPYLGGQFGFGKALKAMARAHNVYMSAGGKKTIVPYVTKRRSSYDLKYMDKLNQSGGEGVDTEIVSAPNLSNIDFSDLSKVPANMRHYAALEEALRTRGQSNRSMLTEVNEFNGENLYSKIVNLSGLLFHQGERMNRNISGIAAYDLKLEQLLEGRPVSSATEAEMQTAADYAIEAIELTNSGSMAETAPRISQSNIGSVLFMYKRFGVSMLYLQFRMLRQALKAGDLNKEERNIAKRQILGLFLTSGAIAGIRGMPMAGFIIWLWNMTKDEDEEDADTILQNYVGEGPFNGILNYTFGLDIAPRIGMTDLLFRSLPNQEATSLADTAFNMAGPIAGIANRMYQGWGLMREGEIYRGAERMVPAIIANGMKSYRYKEEGATTLRGDPITEDIGPGHVLGQALGFAPAGYTRQLERNAMVKRIDRNISETRTRLMRKYYIAMRENDFNTMMEVQQEMLEFSLEHPEVAITPDTIESSVRQHRITDEMTRQLGGITVGRRRFATVLQENMEAGF